MTRFGWVVVLWCGVGAAAVALALRALGLSGWRAVLLGLNAATLLCYGFDKLRARAGMGRVPELALHVLALCGGSPGAFAGQVLFGHKTRDLRFRLVFLAIVLLQALLLLLTAPRRHG